MNRLSQLKQEMLIAALVEGNSVSGSARLAQVTKVTALRNLVWIGTACQKFHDKTVRDLKSTAVEADEMWNFIHAKGKNLPQALKGSRDHGDMWTWIGMCSISKLVIAWHVGKHDSSDAEIFAEDFASRIPGRVQISTDQLQRYRPAIENAFGTRADYATLSKKLGKTPETADGKYEQPKLKAERIASVYGNPNLDAVSTHSIERQNLTVRMSVRRYARATNAFARKIDNTRAALALHFVYYNFARIHSAHRVTPAMEAGISDHVWDIDEIARLVE